MGFLKFGWPGFCNASLHYSIKFLKMKSIDLKNLLLNGFLMLFLGFLGQTIELDAQMAENQKKWQQYTDATEAGFSRELLDSVSNWYQQSGASACLVVSEGKIVLSIGATTRRFMTHSIRKSFLNALFGVEVHKENIELDKTLMELGINDKGQLTFNEKQATVKDLLSARSGIYLPSAYSPQGMIDNLPERGSYSPGTHWFYNNWDFNTLVSIYNQESGKDFFKAFQKEIADPIGMEDFRIQDTYYRYEKEKSDHPAYLMNMSARDMARFGQLYLNKGKWNEKQLVPSGWVEKSTNVISDDLENFTSRGGYGYLWWVDNESYGAKVFYASGVGGHRIVICPEKKLVIVFRANTYENREINRAYLERMVRTIVLAKESPVSPKAEFRSYKPKKRELADLYPGSMDMYLGKYTHRMLGEMEIVKTSFGYELKNNVGTFKLFSLAKDRFFPEDLEVEMKMVKATEESDRHKIEMVFGKDRSMQEVIMYY
jgi:CubicO group peptidase (beta-lactamase class C family)